MLRLKAERMRRGWTPQDLAYHARMAAADVSRIESGRLKPYPSQLARLARVLGISPEELMQYTEPHEIPVRAGDQGGQVVVVRRISPGVSGATTTTVRLVTGAPSPAQLAAWNRLWRLLLAPVADAAHATAPGAKPRSGLLLGEGHDDH